MMIYEDLKKSVEEIKMTDEMKNRIIDNCYLQTIEKEKCVMKKTDKRFQKILPLVAVMVICVITAGAVVANHFRGFRDVIKDNVVIDTVFEESTEMIEIDVEVEDKIIVYASILDYTNLPYTEIEQMESMYYYVINSMENIICKGEAKSSSDFENGRVTFEIPSDNIDNGEYTLVVKYFVGTKKADRPLSINGEWKCAFVK